MPGNNQTTLYALSADKQDFCFRVSGNSKWKCKEKWVCWRGTYDLFRWKQSMYSKSHANKHKLVTFLIPEHRQARVVHQRHEMSSERGQKSYKYWNLQAVVMSDCSLIATRNSHAKHNQSVVRIPEVHKRDMGWCTHVSADKRDISFWIFSPTEV